MNWHACMERAPDVSFVVDGIPPSKKNGQQIMRRGRRTRVEMSDRAKAFETLVKLTAPRGVSLGSNYVWVTITVDEAAARSRIDVWDLGPPPKRGPKHTRRDVHNCADVVMDAIQGIVFDDDRQARAVLTVHGEVGA